MFLPARHLSQPISVPKEHCAKRTHTVDLLLELANWDLIDGNSLSDWIRGGERTQYSEQGKFGMKNFLMGKSNESKGN